MCKSNPTRLCNSAKNKMASTPRGHLEHARDIWLSVKDSNNESEKIEAYIQYTKAQEEYDETRGGQQILAEKIKFSSSKEEKEKLLEKKNKAIERRNAKLSQSVKENGKTCYKCKEAKSYDDFSFNPSNKDGLQKECRACVKDVNKKYYLATPEKNPDRVRGKNLRKEVIRSIVPPILAKGCVDCKEFFPGAMDFDHILERGKKLSEISNFSSIRCEEKDFLPLLKQEIDKCDVRCANCHRIATFERHANNIRINYLSGKKDPRLTKKYKFIYDVLSKSSCVDCGNDNFLVLEFDHVRGAKDFDISSGKNKASLEELKAEIAKCDVRCSNCHRQQTLMRSKGLSSTEQLPKNKNFSFFKNSQSSRNTGLIQKTSISSQPKVIYPSIENLKSEIESTSLLSVAKGLGISDNALRKHLRKNGIEPKELTNSKRSIKRLCVCGNTKHPESSKCSDCTGNKNNRLADYSLESLQELVDNLGITKAAEKIGVARSSLGRKLGLYKK